ncbi:MAG: 23S rRNA (uracil(1939)-C(5))-methyltransferase RlmD [Defluviitaleaceae bacterium]|nr:23S rRNA (uracil(1939)-C(5))-methyltransferase RlmD [Defluviitaleaceae bacterium]
MELIIESLSSEGHGVARHDGLVVFVEGALPGDVVVAEVVKSKKSFANARIARIVKPSPHRVNPPCLAADDCGGCQLQHCDYSAQLNFKRQTVINALERIGGIKNPPVSEVIGMENPRNYRNKGRFFAKDGRIGMYERNSRNLVETPNCLIMHQNIVDAVAALRGVVEDGEIMARTSFDTDEIIVTRDGKLISNTSKITEKIGDITYRLSAKSFFQVNPVQAEVLYDIALKQAGLDGTQTVIDAHVGCGGVMLQAARLTKNAIGVDIEPAAIMDAEFNAKLNGIENAEFICGSAEVAIPELLAEGDKPDVIFLDPPRKGCGQPLLGAIAENKIPRVVYISCDPATLARDVKHLVAEGYALEAVRPVDMFPMTSRVEVCCLLVKI